ncbi:hypothetical protein WDV85_00235 [Pseudokineococcus sp. 5B2Z-1]|uniref:hypothetical protein n=1 Tax=Pseudokineococcus sp. 5B2Z-1 TaxID=3132744 RepID=UPI00309505E6
MIAPLIRRALHRPLACAAALGLVALTGGGVATAAPSSTTSVTSVVASSPSTGVASSNQFWRQDVSKAPLHPNSKAMAADVAKQVADHWGGVAAFNASKFGTSVYTVPATQKRVDIKFWNCQNKSRTPDGLYGEGGQFTSVPVPTNAVVAGGTDMHLSIYQPSSDTLWEFWKAQKRSDGWYACWGGRIDDFSTSEGNFKGTFGAAASGIAIAPGSVRADEVKAGNINHAMSLQLISPKHWKTVSWPAVRSDGTSTSSSAVAEGQRLRLDPSVNVDALGLHPVAKAVAKAAQKYGFVVTDAAGAVAVVGETGAGLKATTGVDPWSSVLGGTPQYAVMKGFPWHKLQALPMDYGKPGTPSAPSATTAPTVPACAS